MKTAQMLSVKKVIWILLPVVCLVASLVIALHNDRLPSTPIDQGILTHLSKPAAKPHDKWCPDSRLYQFATLDDERSYWVLAGRRELEVGTICTIYNTPEKVLIIR